MYISTELLRDHEAKYSLSPQQIATRKAAIKTKTAAELDGAQRFTQRAAMLSATAPDAELAFERYIGDNDLLPINYLPLGAAKSRAIGRLRYFDLRVNRNAMATGFLISPDLILTNHHVFSDKSSFSGALIDFDYAYGIDGRELQKVTFQLDPEKFFYANKDVDCALIGIAEADVTKTNHTSDRGYLVLNPAPGKAGIGDYGTIIQHPDGDYQQIALRGNQIIEIQDLALLYVSDTSPGSSGSPVFNDEWQVIALHSAGVPKKKDGRYVDKDDQPIPEIDGQIDASRVVWISNTGFRVSALVAKWMSDPAINSSPYLQLFNNPNAADQEKAALETGSTNNGNESLQRQTRKIMNTNGIESTSTPSGVTININLNLAAIPVAPAAPPAPPVNDGAVAAAAKPISQKPAGPALASNGASGADTEETKVLEQSQDYSNCAGFDELFMAAHTPMPVLGAQLARKAAALTSNPKQFVLKYDHYSTIMHSVRRMPVVSAINVEGDPSVRRDNQPRKDNWLRDSRIDFDVQLTDQFYKASGFDKGHMSRREDAKWGQTGAAAEAAAQMTCMYTNACPQVPTINRAIRGYHGLWGQLEEIVLEHGVEAERGDDSKICVYNGPVFVPTDPTYKGVQVPMRFFKIIVWKNAAGEMKATAFVLSQEDLVGGIQFEELQFDKEFVEHQCSIAYIEKLTDLTFTGVNQWDTSPDKGNSKAVSRIGESDLEAHLAKNAGGTPQLVGSRPRVKPVNA